MMIAVLLESFSPKLKFRLKKKLLSFQIRCRWSSVLFSTHAKLWDLNLGPVFHLPPKYHLVRVVIGPLRSLSADLHLANRGSGNGFVTCWFGFTVYRIAEQKYIQNK